jgi:hypothetical protein
MENFNEQEIEWLDMLIDYISTNITDESQIIIDKNTDYEYRCPGICLLASQLLVYSIDYTKGTKVKVTYFMLKLHEYLSHTYNSIFCSKKLAYHWFPRYDFSIRLDFLLHVRNTITNNEFKQFDVLTYIKYMPDHIKRLYEYDEYDYRYRN